MDRKIFIYLINISIIFIGLRYFFLHASTYQLDFLLNPTDKLVSVLLNSKSIYVENEGYFHSKENFIIERLCSGANYMLICFLILSFLVFKHSKNIFHQIGFSFISLFLAFIFTIFINSFRIYLSYILQNKVDYYLTKRPHYLLHELIETIYYLVFLTLIYLSVDWILSKKYDEKYRLK